MTKKFFDANRLDNWKKNS